MNVNVYSGIELAIPDKPFVLIFDLFFRTTLIELAVNGVITNAMLGQPNKGRPN